MDTKICEEIDKECASAEEFCESLYKATFAPVFDNVVKLHNRMKSQNHVITDDELEYIITELPLELFSVSESLNKLRLKLEVAKLENGRREVEFKKALSATMVDPSMKPNSVLTQVMKDELMDKMTEYRVFEICYSSVITRVENQLTFSRELIMGAKKVWDSRRSAEATNPIKPKDAQTLLPYPM